jgi:hypothetical protein
MYTLAWVQLPEPGRGEGGEGGGGGDTPTHSILSTVARLPISVPPQLKSNSEGGGTIQYCWLTYDRLTTYSFYT